MKTNIKSTNNSAVLGTFTKYMVSSQLSCWKKMHEMDICLTLLCAGFMNVGYFYTEQKNTEI